MITVICGDRVAFAVILTFFVCDLVSVCDRYPNLGGLCLDCDLCLGLCVCLTVRPLLLGLWCSGLFLPIWGKSNFLFCWEISHRLCKVMSYRVKNYQRKTVMLSFWTVIDTTFHLIINILFTGVMISALQFYDWEKSFWIGKKTFNLALGMGPYFGPMRALEKGLMDHKVRYHDHWLKRYAHIFLSNQ